jgi:hypothetical protein
MRVPKVSKGSDSSVAAGDDEAVGSAAFLGASFLGAGAGAGSAALGLVSSEPTSSLGLYFFRMPSLWYFQNCLDASFPPTLVRIFLPPANEQVRLLPRKRRRLDRLTGVVVLELCQVVDVAVDNDEQVIGLVVRRDVACREDLGHGCDVCEEEDGESEDGQGGKDGLLVGRKKDKRRPWSA